MGGTNTSTSGIYTGDASYKDPNAINKDYGYDQNVALSQNDSWFAKQKAVADKSLIDKGYQYFTGDASTSEAQLRAAGYVKNSEAGGAGGNSANSWYLPPKAKAAAKPSTKSSSKKASPSRLASAGVADQGGTDRNGLHYNPDWNANLKEATIRGNEDNTRRIGEFDAFAKNRTNEFNRGTRGLTDDATGRYNDAYKRYNEEVRGYSDKMGTADQDIHTRNRGQAYAGLDSGFSNANDQLQAQLARRGMAGSGVGAKSMTDLAQDRMRAGGEAGVNAYTSAIDMSDSRRTGRMNTAGNLYGAEQGNIQNNYQMGMGQLGQAYGSDMAVGGQSLQNNINNNQQRIANLMGYSQLGRGMAGMSQNYLSQAGTGYGNIGGQAGQTAIGQGQLNNSFNSTMQQAQQKKDSKGADTLGTAVGAAGSVAMMSDERLKENITKVGTLDNGINICTWDWTDEAKPLVGDAWTTGVIAQQVLDIMPEAVSINKDNGYYQVNYSKVYGGIAS